MTAPLARTSGAVHCQRTCASTLLLVRPFTPCRRLLRPLLTSRLRLSPPPFQAQSEISPGKNAILPRTTAAFTPPEPRPQELRSHLPARPARRRLVSSSCPSARGFASCFLPTLGRPRAVALRFVRCGQLTDFHPQDRAHAGRTRKRQRRNAAFVREKGQGCGVVGVYPGPAVAALVFRLWQPWVFFLTMIAGMLLHRVFKKRTIGSPIVASRADG